jgi:hypothetical protein
MTHQLHNYTTHIGHVYLLVLLSRAITLLHPSLLLQQLANPTRYKEAHSRQHRSIRNLLRCIFQSVMYSGAPKHSTVIHGTLHHVCLQMCIGRKRTPWSRVLLEKLTVTQLVKKFPTFYGIQTFITVFTRPRYLPLS